MNSEMATTPLHEWHLAYGANMAEFGGYDMPLWYPSGAKEEHLAVINTAGIFDTSHMATVKISGPEALDVLQWCVTQDLSACVGKDKAPLSPGKCVYAIYLDENGHVIDDTIISQVDEVTYLSVVNAGMGGPIAKHLQEQSKGRSVEIFDLTDKLAKIDLQGPMAGKILMNILSISSKKVLSHFPYFTFKGHYDLAFQPEEPVRLIDGTPLMLSRTGYTGEFGFELFMDPKYLVRVWVMIMEVGEIYEMMPCGLAARDSLRAGAVLPLSHQDIGEWPFCNNPWTFVLPYNQNKDGFSKEFLGSEALLSVTDPEYTYPFVGYDLRKIVNYDAAEVLDSKGNVIGSLLSCVTDMAIGRHEGWIYSIASPDKPEDFRPRGLCCGFVKVKSPLAVDQVIQIKENKRSIKVQIADDIRPARTARAKMKEMI
jgi:aminomethyltransferase